MTEIIETITYNGKKYNKVVDKTGSCDGCCWNNDREGECAAPNCETFWGCSKGNFIWKKVKEQIL